MVEVNGVNVETLKEALKIVEEQSKDVEKRRLMNIRRARVSWIGGLKAKARSGNGSFIVDESVGEPTETPTAVEYMLGTLGACIVIGFVYLATLRNITIHNLEVSLEGELDNINVFLALSDEGHSGYKSISLTLYVSADADEETLRKIFEEAIRRSPLVSTLNNAVEVKGVIRIV